MIDRAVIERLAGTISEDDFERKFHRDVFADIMRLYRSGAECDICAVNASFTARGEHKAADIADITSATYTSANVDYYVGIVKDCAVRRATLNIALTAKERIMNMNEKGADVSADIERQISEVNLGHFGTEYKHVSRFLLEVGEDLDRAVETNGKVRGVEAPFKGLEDITDFRDGEYIILAARPSIGKTAMMLTMAETIAINRKIPTGIFSIEMSARQLNLRLVSQMCCYSWWAMSKGMYRSANDKAKITHSMIEIGESPIYIDETSGIRLSELKMKARRMVKVNKCKILFVDYVALINAEQPKIPRHEQIAEISRTVKSLCKELDVPIVLLSQLTRDTEGKKPTLNSLAETRSLEQDADVVMFIHRERTEDVDPNRRQEIDSELIVAKNRNGPTGVCKLIYKPRLTKFYDVEGAK
jgi:replicative DNA helicase